MQSPQKSLHSRTPKISVNRLIPKINTPNGTNFCSAGGSWSSAWGTFPSRSVLVLSPQRVFAQLHFGLRIDRDFQRFRVRLRFGTYRFDIFKDRIGVFSLLQRLAFLNSFQPIVHAIKNVTQGAFAGQFLFGVATVKQGPPQRGWYTVDRF